MLASSIGNNFPNWILVAFVAKVAIALHGDKGLLVGLSKHSSSSSSSVPTPLDILSTLFFVLMTMKLIPSSQLPL